MTPNELDKILKDIEERLCPCEQHKWICIDTEYDVGTAPGDLTTYYTYKCQRCGKTRRTWEPIIECHGGDLDV